MQNSGISKSKAASKSCTACRLSKIKCVLSEENGQECSRCGRLGLKCVFEPSKRGRQCVSRDKARLGPAVRALLRATATESDDEASRSTQAQHLAVQMEQTHATDIEVLCWCGDQCQRKMVLSIQSSSGRLALLKHWLLIGVRSGNCGTWSQRVVLALFATPMPGTPTRPQPHPCRRVTCGAQPC